MKFKEGDKVKILHNYYNDRIGWNSAMDEYIGKIVTVHRGHKDFFTITEESKWCFPYECAELVPPEKIYFNTNNAVEEALDYYNIYQKEDYNKEKKEEFMHDVIESLYRALKSKLVGDMDTIEQEKFINYYNLYKNKDYNKCYKFHISNIKK